MIESIVYKPQNPQNAPANAFHRVALQRATLIAGYGIEGDAKGGHPKRQLNIMCIDTLRDLQDAGYDIEPGHMGEQITVSGVDLMSMHTGDRLQLGEALVEMTGFREGCLRFESNQGMDNPTAEIPGTLGIMARVVSGGFIAVGDVVRVLAPEA